MGIRYQQPQSPTRADFAAFPNLLFAGVPGAFCTKAISAESGNDAVTVNGVGLQYNSGNSTQVYTGKTIGDYTLVAVCEIAHETLERHILDFDYISSSWRGFQLRQFNYNLEFIPFDNAGTPAFCTVSTVPVSTGPVIGTVVARQKAGKSSLDTSIGSAVDTSLSTVRGISGGLSVFVGQSANNSTFASRPILFYAVFDGYLDDATVSRLIANPWQIFRKQTNATLLKTFAAGGTSGNASGALPTVALNAITATANGGALASGTLSALVLSAITGTASAGTGATASGSLPTIQLSAVAGTASGGALATGGNTTITLSPITGTAIAGGATAIGTLAAMYLAVPTGYATSGSTATGSLPTIQLSPFAGIAYSIISNSALPKYTVKSNSRNYSTTLIRGSYVSTKKRP